MRFPMRRLKHYIALLFAAIVLFPIVMQTVHFVWSPEEKHHCCSHDCTERRDKLSDQAIYSVTLSTSHEQCAICDYTFVTRDLPLHNAWLLYKPVVFLKLLLRDLEHPYRIAIRLFKSRAPPLFFK